MIFTDGTHLVSNCCIHELHSFARNIGLKKHYFHGVRKGHPHYDLIKKGSYEKAINSGARKIPKRELVGLYK